MMKIEMVTSSTEVFKLITIACLFIEPDEKGVKVFLVEMCKITICSIKIILTLHATELSYFPSIFKGFKSHFYPFLCLHVDFFLSKCLLDMSYALSCCCPK